MHPPKSQTYQSNYENAIDSKDLIAQDAGDMIQMEKDWDRATANYDYIMIPNKPPIRRKHRNVWTDADESEIAKQRKFTLYLPRLVLSEQGNFLAGTTYKDPYNPETEVLKAVHEANQLKKKIYIPQDTGVNYIGMIIGPKGLYQKRLEEETNCKILIRGKGSQK